ncbi:LysR substrate-binding domain-containing protein [Craterilacuibacter sinensis]|uniref:LysR family transcriptional regulator n=1 Tax=Craterilacuibacter sinensis TaxID=2686017 RepID=A0A845BND1_9NEIS|nr:LysR substrate-binding domain-containing protein [Craterilacuibacter sinensis]MXR35961.1 LysR family transcriptional regulator [Craterilacuibacter sinensis]
MKRACPSIHELLAFEAVARHLSVTQAADELCVTPSAVSRQISGLEMFLGVELLARVGRAFVLTHTGRHYLQRIQPALRMLESATNDLASSQHGRGTLSVSCVPTFMTKWLIPRLPAFSSAYPQVTLAFHQHLSGRQAQPHDVDIAIRYGSGHWPGIVADNIAGRHFILVASAQPADAAALPRSASDLAQARILIHQGEPDIWAQWCNARGLAAQPLRSSARFEHYSSLISAVEIGMGYALVPRCLVEGEIASGRIIEPFDSAEVLDQGHYLCYREEQLESPVFLAFRNWILEQGHKVGGPGLPEQQNVIPEFE